MGKTLMIVDGAQYVVRFRMMNPQGFLVAETTLPFFAGSEVGPRPGPNPEPDPDDPVIKLDAVSHDFGLALAEWMASPSTKAPTLTPALTDFLRKPTVNDPAVLGSQAAIATYALHHRRVTAASLPDQTAFWLMQMPKKEPRLSTWLKNIEVTQKGQLTLFKPRSPLTARETRTDRASLEALFDSIQKEGRPTLDAVSKFLLQNKQSYVLSPYTYVLGKKDLLDRIFALDSRFARLYGSLDVNQKATLRQSKPLGLSQLRPDQQALIREFVYGLDTIPVPPRPNPPSVTDPNAFGGSPYRDYRSLRNEVTERFANGLPADFKLTGDFEEGTAYFLEKPDQHLAPATPRDFAVEIMSRERPDLSPKTRKLLPLKEVRTGTGRAWKLRLHLGDYVPAGTLRDDELAEKPIPFTSMDKAFRAQIDAEVERLRTMLKDRKANQKRDPKIPPRVRI